MSFSFPTATKKLLQFMKSTKGYQLHRYTVASIKDVVSKPSVALFLAPGLGKTLILLISFLILKELKKTKKILIIAPVRVIYNVWPKEIDKWNLPIKYTILHGIDKDIAFSKNVDVYLTNYESLEWLVSKIGPENKFDWLALDESSKIKNTKTKRFKVLKKLSTKFNRKTIMTGSPAPNSLKDLFGQFYFLDGGAALGRYITGFMNTYFYPSGYMGYEWKLKDGAEKEIYRRVSDICVRFGEEELDLPPLTKVIRSIDLNDAARRTYNAMEKEFIIGLDSKVIVAKNAASASSKLRQIANGNIYDEKGKIVHIHNSKILELEEVISELQGNPCLVVYEFEHDLKSMLEVFPNTPYINGKVSAAKGKQIETLWNKKKIALLFAQISAVSHGMNMQVGGHHIVMYCQTWSLEDYDQLIRRLWRQGQKHPVVVFSIVVKDSIEEAMISAIDKKFKGQNDFLEAIRKYYDTKRNPAVITAEKESNKSGVPLMCAEDYLSNNKDLARTPPAKLSSNKKKVPTRRIASSTSQTTELESDLLRFLKVKRGRHIDAMADKLGVDRRKVQNLIASLRRKGFTVKSLGGGLFKTTEY